MEIVESNGKYLVIQEGQGVYLALSYEEAQGYIEWQQRSDAGNPNECVEC